MPSRNSKADAASISSIFDKAKPTWISTHSPGLGGSSQSSPMLINRRTPLTSTLARSGCSAKSSITSPGMPRHMGHHFLIPEIGECGEAELPQHLIDRGLSLLDPVHRGGWRDEQVVDAVQFGHLPALVAGQPDGEHPPPARLAHGAPQVAGVAAGRHPA